MNSVPLVSIIIPVYNGANYLKDAIDSALAQTYRNIEILVINDGSNDNGKTREIALSYGSKIRYFEKENGGVATALNFGIEKMHGEYFSWLSHDDVYLPRKIQASVEAVLASTDRTQSVCCNNEWLDMSTGIIKQHVYRYPKRYLECGLSMFLFAIPTGCALLIHKSYFEKYGYFDTTKRCVQDSLQWFKFYKNNNLIYLPEVLVRVRLHPEQGTRTEKIMSKEENDLFIYIMDNIREEDLSPMNWSLYLFYSFWLTSRLSEIYKLTCDCAVNKMKLLEDQRNYSNAYLSVKNLMLETNRLILYCAGKRFKKIAFNFTARGFTIDGFSDSNVKQLKSDINGILPILPSDLNKEKDCIIITKANPSDVKESLIQQGFKHVYTYDEDFFPLFIEIPIKKDFLDDYEKWL